MMQTITLQESARLELAGAMKRLQRAQAELEYFFAVHGETDLRQLHILQVEIDEATRLVQHCCKEVQWAQGEIST